MPSVRLRRTPARGPFANAVLQLRTGAFLGRGLWRMRRGRAPWQSRAGRRR